MATRLQRINRLIDRMLDGASAIYGGDLVAENDSSGVKKGEIDILLHLDSDGVSNFLFFVRNTIVHPDRRATFGLGYVSMFRDVSDAADQLEQFHTSSKDA